MLKRTYLMFVSALMLLSFMSLYTQQVSARDGILSFVPILYLEVDTSKLDVIEPGGPAVVLPVRVSYYIPAPPILEGHPILTKLIVFRTPFIVPPVKVHLEVVNKPDWMDVSISTPDVYMSPDINKYSYANTSISISLYKEAPAQPFTLILRASSDEIGNVRSQFTEAQFKITPGYIPLVTITTDEPIKEAGPMTTLTYPIKIMNNANKETIIRLVDIKSIPGWAIKPSQYQVVIPQGKEATISISVTTPYGFGWIAGQMETIDMKFIALPSPPPATYEETPSNTYIYSLGVRSGSLPMIGLIGGIIAVIVAILFLLLVIFKKKGIYALRAGKET
ncbi:MAG: hypothetical protein J7L20_01870 [Thermoplasmata archaeon]|nr:hypothetical protein [Thermoplasmata archaeon]